jgi:Fe-Mn family superoxide dismutase
MDVWEHAFMVDYKPTERGKYIDAFFANVDWSVVGRRVGSAEDSVRVASDH